MSLSRSSEILRVRSNAAIQPGRPPACPWWGYPSSPNQNGLLKHLGFGQALKGVSALDWSNIISGIVGGIAGALATVLYQKHQESKKALEEQRFRIYMMILELNGLHFWIASAEVHGELASPEIRQKFNSMRWRIADELRRADDLPELEAILNVIMSLDYKTEQERAKAFEQIIDQLGGKANPRYQRAIQQVSERSQRLMMTNMDDFFLRKKKVEP
jgi:hypothetical protein